MIKKTKRYKEIKKKWGDKKWWKGRYRHRILVHILHNNGTYVLDEKWDNLVILDACRYDIFKEVNILEGKLEYRTSRGSSTEEFLIENFRKHPRYSNFRDIVYITANPYVNLLLSDKFNKIYPIWDYGWDDSLNTVPPGSVVKETLKAHKKHSDKRLIVHFMQPHSPFLGAKFAHVTGFREHRNAALKNRDQFGDSTVWNLLEKGELDRQEVWLAYKENLEIVLPYVKKLIVMLPGRTVVTSDHGNLFGERPHILYPFKEFGHPDGLYVRRLVLVPWLIVDRKKEKGTEKRKIRSKIDKLKNSGKI